MLTVGVPGVSSRATAATLDLNGVNKTLPSGPFVTPYLTGTDNVTNTGGADATLTEGGGPTPNIYAGIISNGASRTGVTHTNGNVTLTGANSFTGGLLIQGGTVALSGLGKLGGAANTVSVTGGSLDIGSTSQAITAFSAGVGSTVLVNGGTLTAGLLTDG